MASDSDDVYIYYGVIKSYVEHKWSAEMGPREDRGHGREIRFGYIPTY